jgi:hypothetical protein
VTKLLNEDQKRELIQICLDFFAAVHHRSKAILDSIVTMEELMRCSHTPETKKQTKQAVDTWGPAMPSKGMGAHQ